MKKIYILSLLAAGLIATGCSKEKPFGGESGGEGSVPKEALDMSVPDQNIQVNAPTRADINVDDFTVNFIREGATAATKSYRYGEMPNVVTLEQGTYKATASYGEDREAEWENPYYMGTSLPFEVRAYEITSYIDPIECALGNIKATIEFDPALAAAMSADSYVEVKVGDNNGLKYHLEEANAGKAGYFRHTDETTLVATFHGTVNGSTAVETKSYDGIQKGRWYKLTFKLHSGSGSGQGSIEGDILVDANVNVEDVNADVTVAYDEPLDDSERPNEGDDPNPPTPPTGEAPQIVSDCSLAFDVVNNVDESTVCKFHITSSADSGFTYLTCDIISPDLTPEELGGMGLTSHIDLVNTPADMAETLTNLGFPVNIGGKKRADFDMTAFMGLMAVFGDHMHQFKLTVKDANGETVKTLKLQF